jgi:hypothetical protein
MKLLAATTTTQGDHRGDFAWTADGEYLLIGFVCDTDRGDPDGGCGCGRSFEGISSLRATTTAEVVEAPLSHDEFVSQIIESMTRAGWNEMDDFHRVCEERAEEIEDLIEELPVGTIVGRRIDEIVVRKEA